MATRISLPATGKKTGCYGLDFPDGTSYTGRPGGSVVVEDHHADQVTGSSNGHLGLISATLTTQLGTRKTQRCQACRRDWQAWTVTCRLCGQDTTPC
jgi:hypothetical protein